MATRHEVTCIVPDSSTDPDRRIDALGGSDGGGGGWKMREDDVIRGLDSGAFTLFVRTRNPYVPTAEVVVRQGRYRRYVTTEPDGYLSNNLLYLPVCPTTYRQVA
jgi:hypothetical protein